MAVEKAANPAAPKIPALTPAEFINEKQLVISHEDIIINIIFNQTRYH